MLLGILEDIGDILPDLVKKYAPPDPPFSSIFIMIVGLCLSLTIAFVSKQLIDLDKLKKYTREQKEYRKLQWKVQKTADRKLKLELDRKSRRMKRINSELSSMRMKPMLIYMIPLMLVFFALSSFYSPNGHTDRYHIVEDTVNQNFVIKGVIEEGTYENTFFSKYLGNKNDRNKESEVKTLNIRELDDELDIQMIFKGLVNFPEYKIEMLINSTEGGENLTISYAKNSQSPLEEDWIDIAQILNGSLKILNMTQYFNLSSLPHTWGLLNTTREGYIAFQLNNEYKPNDYFGFRITDSIQNSSTLKNDTLIKIDFIELRAHRNNRAAVIPYHLPIGFIGKDFETASGTFTQIHFVWWYLFVNITIGSIVQKLAGLQPE